MWRYITRRLAGLVPLLLLISLVCFALMHAVPGGPTGVLGENPKVSQEDLERIRANFGLDRPVGVQYGYWLRRVVMHGDLGRSYVTGEPVAQMIVRRIPATIELVGAAFLLALLFGLGLGILAALKRGTRTDAWITLAVLITISIPVFWSGLMSIVVFAVAWPVLPSGGMRTLGSAFSMLDHLRHLVLPASVLSLFFIASWSRYVRAGLVDVMQTNYFLVARAKGNSPLGAILRHGLKNGLAPLITVIALHVPALFTGAVITETLFSWPGMGRLFYDGLVTMDYSRVMGIVLISSLMIAFSNLLADVAYGFLDPRTRKA